MAKKAAKKILTPTAQMRRAKRNTPAVAGPRLVQDFNPTAEAGGPEARQIGQETEVLDEMQSGFDHTKDLAEQVRDKWDERVQKEGTKHYECPFCAVEAREAFKTAKACNTHIDKHHKQQVATFKQNKMPEHTYRAKEVIIAPKRRMEDFMPPGQSDKLRRFTVPSNGNSIPVQDIKMRGLGEKSLAPGQLIAMTQSKAVEALKRVADKDLEEAYNLASAHSKFDLKKAIRRRMDDLANSGPKVHAGGPNLKPSQRLIVETSYARRGR